MEYTLENVDRELFKVLSEKDGMTKLFPVICEIIHASVKVGNEGVREIYISVYDALADMVRFVHFVGADGQFGHEDRRPNMKGLTEKLFFLTSENSLIELDEEFKKNLTTGTAEQIGVDYRSWAGVKRDLESGNKVAIVIQSNHTITEEHTDILEVMMGPIAIAMEIWLGNKNLLDTNAKLGITNQHLKLEKQRIEEMTYIITHDIKNVGLSLYNSIKTIREYILKLLSLIQSEGLKDIIARLTEQLGFIEIGREKIRSFVTSMSKASELGQIPLSIQLFNPEEIILQCLKVLSPEIERREIEVVVGEFPKQVIESDPGMLSRIADNLINNSVKYSKKKGGEIIISATSEGEYIIISFSDNGIGMDLNTKKNALKRCYWPDRIDQEGNKVPGYSDGLPSVAMSVDRLGGEVSVKSAKGKGTTFIVTIPKKIKAEEEV
jgi:signal transduction histidine kinase